jgi:hypothetical protein
VLTFGEDVLPWVCCGDQHAWQVKTNGREIGNSEDANAYTPLFAVGGTSCPLTDRFALWLMGAQMLTPGVAINGVSIDLQIWQGGMAAATLRWSGTVALTATGAAQSADTAGWIVQVRGVLGETWYVYARITPGSLPGGAPVDSVLKTSWRAYGDRHGGVPGSDVPAGP